MRKRQVQQGSIASANLPSDKSKQQPTISTENIQRTPFTAAVLSVVITVSLFFIISINSHRGIEGIEHATSRTQSSKSPPDYNLYQNCTISFSPPPPKPSKPLWLPSFPNSFEDNLIKNLISGITGWNNGGRSFYAQGPKFKKCKGSTPTAVCLVIHPLIEMKPGPEHLKDFDSKVVYAIRNPMTTFPAYFNMKAIKYHRQIGQVPENSWREFRDEYLENLMEQWKTQLRTWKSTSYAIGMYFVYERFMDMSTGPEMVRQLADLLKDRGFDVASGEDIPCIYYRSTGRETLEQYIKYGYEYTNYKPGYTLPQQDFMIASLESFIEENRNDTELVEILKMYQLEIRDGARLDVPFINDTAVQ